MNSKSFLYVFIGAASSVAMPVCSHDHHDVVIVEQPRAVVVAPAPMVVAAPPVVAAGPVMIAPEAPPPDQVEVVGVAPYPDAYWIGGSWRWNNRWVWSAGYWGRRPHADAVWEHDSWRQHEGYHGWHHHEGRWR